MNSVTEELQKVCVVLLSHVSIWSTVYFAVPKKVEELGERLFPEIDYATRQLWKLEGTKFINKANDWKYIFGEEVDEDEWNFKPEGDLFYIENTTRDKVLAVTIDSKHKETHIRLSDMVIDRENAYGGYFTTSGRLWKKGPTDEDGYFKITDPESGKILTAVSYKCLEILDPEKETSDSEKNTSDPDLEANFHALTEDR